MEIVCPYCDSKQNKDVKTGDLIRCDSCHKPFEVGMKPRPRPAAAATTISRMIPPEPRHKPAQDITVSEFGTGLLVASIVGGVGYVVVLLAVITLSLGSFGRNPGGNALVALAILMAGLGCILAAQIARATMKTADYTRIIAQNSME